MRNTGWYWVKLEKEGEWVLASWDGFSEVWWVGMDCYDSRAFAEINEQRILNPDEIPTTN